MRIVYSYCRLLLGSWLLMGGIALQFYPSVSAAERDTRWRERQLVSIPTDERPGWVKRQDNEDASAQAAIRMTGVLIGGLGLTAALHEVVFLSASYRRRSRSGDKRRVGTFE